MLPLLSFDIQVEIAKRLPVKSLIQFRSVCKAWKSLSESSQFIAGYNFRHDQSEHLVLKYEVGGLEEMEVKYVSLVDDDTFPQKKFALTVPPLVQLTTKTIIGSSHGLLCLNGYFEEPGRTRMTVLWNPSIRKSIAVAVPHVVRHLFSYVIGFGVCPDTKDPKLVKITYINESCEIESISCIPSQVMVFTLSSREWTPSRSNQLPRKSIQFTWSQVVVGQFIYWRAYDQIDGEYRNLIMSFDMSTEEFREIDVPDCLADPCDSDFTISMLRESLALVEYYEVGNGTGLPTKHVCDVWMMEHGDSKAFTKLFTMNTSVSLTLGFRKSGEPIFEMRDDNKDFHAPCELAVYEPCSEHIKELGICGNKYSFLVSSYTESLLLLDHDDGHIVRRGAVKRSLLE